MQELDGGTAPLATTQSDYGRRAGLPVRPVRYPDRRRARVGPGRVNRTGPVVGRVAAGRWPAGGRASAAPARSAHELSPPRHARPCLLRPRARRVSPPRGGPGVPSREDTQTITTNELSERIQKRKALETEKHAARDDAADRTLAALDLLTARLDSITPRLIAFSDLIGGPEPETDGTRAPRTVLN